MVQMPYHGCVALKGPHLLLQPEIRMYFFSSICILQASQLHCDAIGPGSGMVRLEFIQNFYMWQGTYAF